MQAGAWTYEEGTRAQTEDPEPDRHGVLCIRKSIARSDGEYRDETYTNTAMDAVTDGERSAGQR
jgi:hypothetical protein